MPLSERTKHYVRSFIREGDAFNQEKWLAQVRAEEAAKTSVDDSVGLSNEIACPVESIPPDANGGPKERQQSSGKGSLVKAGATTRELEAAKAIKKLSRAWSDTQRSRDRNAIYDYLTCVYSLVQKYRQRGQLKQLVRGAQQFVGLPRNKQADPYTTVIRATTCGEIDHRAVSKYARALRYSRKRKGNESLQAFIKSKGGINSCAARYAKRH
jgi:hypothetical protein